MRKKRDYSDCHCYSCDGKWWESRATKRAKRQAQYAERDRHNELKDLLKSIDKKLNG